MEVHKPQVAPEIHGKCCRQLSAKICKKIPLKCCGKYLCNSCWGKMYHHNKKIRLKECPYCKISFRKIPRKKTTERKQKYINKSVIIVKGIYKNYYGLIYEISNRKTEIFLIELEAKYKRIWFTKDEFKIL